MGAPGRRAPRAKPDAPVMAPLTGNPWWADFYARHRLPPLSDADEATARILGRHGAERGLASPRPDDRTALEAQAELAAGETHHRIVLRAYEYAETDPRRQQTLRLGAAFADADLGEAARLVSRWIRRGRSDGPSPSP